MLFIPKNVVAIIDAFSIRKRTSRGIKLLSVINKLSTEKHNTPQEGHAPSFITKEP